MSVRGFCLALMAIQALPALGGSPLVSPAQGQELRYPEVRKADVVTDYHGTRVADPYRWLEDTDASETRSWIEAQNRVTFGYLEGIEGREELRERLTELRDHERYEGTPFREGDRTFFYRNDGLQDHAVLYWQPSLEAEARELIDPNRLSEDGTVSLAGTSVSENGRYLAYATSDGGSDWREVRVREIDTGRDLEDHLEWIKFSGLAWTHDHEGFFYSRYPEPEGDPLLAENHDHRLYYHRLGTDQEEDVLVYERPDEPEWNLNGRVTPDGRYLVIRLSHGTDRRSRIHYVDLEDPVAPTLTGPVVELLDAFDAAYSFVDNDGPVFYFRTDLQAPLGRLIAVDTRRPEREHWETVIPEAEHPLREVEPAGERLVATYLEDAHERVRFFDRSGEPAGELELPTLGSVDIRADRGDPEMFYSFTSFLHPRTIFRYDLETDRSELFGEPELDFDFERYRTRQVFYRSADGTRVPMFITHRRDLELDGTNPTLLYGYGGFDISLLPSFSVDDLVWLERGGVYAVANLRGGGEYGEEWHRAGMRENKQNVFDDFIAAAEYLIDEGYTAPERLAIAGGSNGGLLVGAAMTQRPDLFGVALPAVGVMDMLRFHRFTIGWAWVPEYGSAEESREQFETLYAYSPLHNLEPGTCYPATLATTADHDDRVVPGHSFKFISRLQDVQGCDRPVLIRIETRAGHGAGKPTWMIIEEQADRWAFLMSELGMENPSTN